jgi:hypothetical protein
VSDFFVITLINGTEHKIEATPTQYVQFVTQLIISNETAKDILRLLKVQAHDVVSITIKSE